MATKPIIEVAVDDTAFQRFKQSYNAFTARAQRAPVTPGAPAAPTWATVGRSNVIIINPAQKFAERLKKTTEDTVSPMNKLAKATGNVADGIQKATASLIRWAGITSIVTGLLGVGGSLFGMDRLAASASGMRRAAGGLGVSASQQAALDINYGRYIDTDANLRAIADAKSDMTKRWAFSAMGVSGVDQKTPAQLATEMAVKAKQTFERYGQTQQGAEAHGLLNFYSMDELRRLHATSYEDLDKAQRDTDRDTRRLGLGDPVLKEWQDFLVILKRASATMESVFINRLAGLTGPLGRLSEAFSNALDVFLGSPIVKQWIDDLGDALKRLGDWMNGPDFKSDVDSFVHGVATLAGAIGDAVRWIRDKLDLGPSDPAADRAKGIVPEVEKSEGWGGKWLYRHVPMLRGLDNYLEGYTTDGTPRSDVPIAPYAPTDPLHPTRQRGGGDDDDVPANPGLGWLEGVRRWWNAPAAPALPSGPRGRFVSGIGPASYEPGNDNLPSGSDRATSPNAFGGIEQNDNLPRGTLWNVYGAESSYGRDPSTSSAGAQGPFQFMPDTARQEGLADPSNTMQAAAAAGRYIAELQRQFGGSIEKALAAYNWGPGNLKGDIEAHGDAWKQYLPRETSDYVAKTARGLDQDGSGSMQAAAPAQSSRQVVITVYNTTGGNAATSVRQLAV